LNILRFSEGTLHILLLASPGAWLRLNHR
jgi:hypothetical protein